MNVIVRVVSSDSKRSTMLIKSKVELTTVESDLDGEAMLKLALAFEVTEVDIYSADARNAMNIWGTISAPLEAGPSVDTVGIPAIFVTFQPPEQSGSEIKASWVQRNGV